MFFHVEKMQLLYDSNHFHGQSIWICVFFKSGDSHERRQRLLVLLSPGGIRIEQFVTNCGGERLPCNNLYVTSNLHVSNSAMFVHTYIYSFYYMPSYSIDWHLLDVVHNILNMQRYVTSAAGQTCSFSDKAVKGGSQYPCLNENVPLLRHS